MNDPINTSLYHILDRLKNAAVRVNVPTNLDGLLAAHINIGTRLQRVVNWNVYISPREWLDQPEASLEQAPHLAILGCLLDAQIQRTGMLDQQAVTAFTGALQRLRQRQHSFASAVHWVSHSDVVLGIALGVRVVNDREYQGWLRCLVEEALQRADLQLLQRLMFIYVSSLLMEAAPNAMLIPAIDPKRCSIAELALAIRLCRRDLVEIIGVERSLWMEEAQATLIRRLLIEPGYEGTDFKVSLIWEVASSYIETRSHYPRLDMVNTILSNIPAGLERWRDHWLISDEYDVQSLLWLALRPYLEDLRYEESLAKLGRSGHRYDLASPQLGLIIEAKYIRRDQDFQKIVDEVAKDSAQIQVQSAFTRLMVFVFDPTCAIQHHDWTRQALEQIALVQRAFIIPAPSLMRQNAKNGRKGSQRNRQATRHRSAPRQ
jgi:hypothetical protein